MLSESDVYKRFDRFSEFINWRIRQTDSTNTSFEQFIKRTGSLESFVHVNLTVRLFCEVNIMEICNTESFYLITFFSAWFCTVSEKQMRAFLIIFAIYSFSKYICCVPFFFNLVLVLRGLVFSVTCTYLHVVVCLLAFSCCYDTREISRHIS